MLGGCCCDFDFVGKICNTFVLIIYIYFLLLIIFIIQIALLQRIHTDRTINKSIANIICADNLYNRAQ